MTKHVLIVHPDSNMILEVRDILEKVGLSEGFHPSVKWAKNQAAAESQAKEAQIDLVITALEIAAGERPQEGAGEESKRGIALIRGLRVTRPAMAAILIITGNVDDELQDFTTLEDAGLARAGQQFERHLGSEVRRRLATGTIEPPAPKRINIDISLSKEPANCICTFCSGGQLLLRPVVLTIDAQNLGELVEKSRSIDIGDPGHRWKREMREVGKALAQEIFQPTPEGQRFSEFFSECRVSVGNENMRIRFTAQDKLHPIPLEALKKKHDDYLMLQTPIYRREGVPALCRAPPGAGAFPGEAGARPADQSPHHPGRRARQRLRGGEGSEDQPGTASLSEEGGGGDRGAAGKAQTARGPRRRGACHPPEHRS